MGTARSLYPSCGWPRFWLHGAPATQQSPFHARAFSLRAERQGFVRRERQSRHAPVTAGLLARVPPNVYAAPIRTARTGPTSATLEEA